MKVINTLLFLGILLFVLPTLAQEKSPTLDDQFVDVIDKSNRYEDYKVVKIYKLNKLKKNVLDSIKVFKDSLNNAHGTIDQQQFEITAVKDSLVTLQSELSISKQKEDGISLFGSLIKKSTYKTTMWSIIGLLGLIVLFLFYKFKNSNAVTRDANNRLAETEAEFDEHRQKNLEQQQVLRRKLQDEINKNK
jgi:hypothetical protein